MTDQHKKRIGIFAVVFFVLFMAALFWFVGRPMIRYVEDPDQYRTWIQDKGILAEISFIGMMFFQVVVAIIPGEPLEICAGYAFGAIEGTLLCLIGIVLGSAVIFMLVRCLGVKLVEVFFSINKINSISFLNNCKKRNAIAFLILMIPGTPKDLISYFAGLTNMKLTEWLIICTIARIPSVLTSTLGGDALASQDYILASVIFIITATISILGIVIYNRIAHH